MRIVKETGKPVSYVTRDLGINEYTLHNWVQMDRHASGQAVGGGGGTLKESESEELERLRRKKAELVKQHAREKCQSRETVETVLCHSGPQRGR